MTSLCLRFTSGQIFGESFSVVHRLLSGGVRVQVSSHVLDLQLQLRSLPGALRHSYRCDAFYTIVLISRHTRTLKAMCSRKWAVHCCAHFHTGFRHQSIDQPASCDQNRGHLGKWGHFFPVSSMKTVFTWILQILWSFTSSHRTFPPIQL